MDKNTGTILDIQRLSTEDGPGLRTTVFLKGCSLECTWCHNPESIKFSPQVQWIEEGRCINCGLCVNACPIGGLALTDSGIIINRELCRACGTCVNICPTGALEIKGEVWDTDSLIYEVSKDRSFFGTDGGVTFSGGESLMQPDFVADALKKLRNAGIHTAVDTAGLVPRVVIKDVLPLADLVLYDLKLIDMEQHRYYTGADNVIILGNAKWLADYYSINGRPEIWIRTPIIPGVTDTHENIRGIGAFIAENMSDCVSRWELCAFNNLCASKYRRLGIDWKFKHTGKVKAQTMEELTKTARASGIKSGVVLWTGSTNP